MTLDELKAEAKKLGYHLVKDRLSIVLLPCPICGKRLTRGLYDSFNDYYFRRCWYCECFDGKLGKTIDEAKLGWNIAVENYNKTKEEN